MWPCNFTGLAVEDLCEYTLAYQSRQPEANCALYIDTDVAN